MLQFIASHSTESHVLRCTPHTILYKNTLIAIPYVFISLSQNHQHSRSQIYTVEMVGF